MLSRRLVKPHHETGAALALVLVVVVFLGALSVAIAGYTMTGLKRTTSANLKIRTTMDAEAVANWYVEELTYRRQTQCLSTIAPPGPIVDVAVPANLGTADSALHLTCQFVGWINGHPVVDIVAGATNHGATTVVTARAQMSAIERRLALLDWTIS